MMGRDELRRLIAGATGIDMDRLKIWVTNPGCIEVRMPRDTTSRDLLLVQVEALKLVPCWVYVEVLRDMEWRETR